MKYDKRNRIELDKLSPNTKKKAYAFYQYCLDHDVEVLIYETMRTPETQKRYVETGASQTMRSYHLVGQALDFVPVVDGKTSWSASAYKSKKVMDAIAYAKKIGFEWGGDWKSFVDMPHLQFNYKGYGTDVEEKKQSFLHILKPINLWKRDENHDITFVRILNPGEKYKVYGYDGLYGGQYNVGSRHYVTNMGGYVRLEE